MHPRNRIAAVGVVAAGALLLAGCATSGSGENDSESEPQEVSTEITDEEVNLVLAYVDDPPTPALVEGFEEERSEEHTSELQSRGHLVCRLLLEKTNTQYAKTTTPCKS